MSPSGKDPNELERFLRSLGDPSVDMLSDQAEPLVPHRIEPPARAKGGRPSTVDPARIEVLRAFLRGKNFYDEDGALIVTKTKAIRALHINGATVPEIAATLNIIYQHAYNVVRQYINFNSSLKKNNEEEGVK